MTVINSRMVLALTALLLAGLVFVPIVSAADEFTSNGVVSTPEQVKKINDLWGKDITIGQYFEEVHPEYFKEMTAAEREESYKHKMNWGVTPSRSQKSPNIGIPMTATQLYTEANYAKDTNRIWYRGHTWTVGGQVNYLYVEAFLLNSASQTVSSTSWRANPGSDVVAASNVYYPDPDSFYIHAWGYTPSPYMEDEADSNWFTYP